MRVFNVVNVYYYLEVPEIFCGTIQSIGRPSSNDDVKTHGKDTKMKWGPKPKRIRLSEGNKLTLKAGPLLPKSYVLAFIYYPQLMTLTKYSYWPSILLSYITRSNKVISVKP